MTAVLFTIGLILLFVLANGLFVAAEFAIVGAPRPALEHLAAAGNRRARRVVSIIDNRHRRDRYIATTQIGVSLASLGLGMYGEHVVAGWISESLGGFSIAGWITANTIASVLAIAVLTYVHIVLGEMVPKTLALQGATRTALWVSPLIEGLQVPLMPLVRVLNGIRNMVLRAVGVKGEVAEEERYHTTEELQLIIQESQESGLLRGEAGRILNELFEFGDLKAWQVMVPRVHIVSIPVNASTAITRDIVRMWPHTRYPIHDGDLDHIVGSVHMKDLLRHLVSDQPINPSEAREVPYVPATVPVDELLAAMRRSRSQMAVVMDEHGGTAGIVTIEDLFEEVVGEIDEGRGRTPIWRDPSGRVLVRGTVRLKDVGESLGRTFEHPDVQTMSGLVLTLLGRPAVVGDVVRWKNVRIDVTAVSGRGVQDTALTVLQPAARTAAPSETAPQTDR